MLFMCLEKMVYFNW